MDTSESGQRPNALTIDVEDYFHVSAFRHFVPYAEWDHMESRVEPNTHKVLELLEEFRLHATFFVLGWVAERYPPLIRAIQAAGHELGCHSYAHRLVYELSPDEFRTDTRRALRAIEDVAGLPVRAYRAPSFSITARSLWALEILLELGFTVDSSIFPARNWLYGIPNAPRQPFRIRINGSDLLEFPPATLKIVGRNTPATGGAYLRLLPYRFQELALAGMADRGEPIVLYFHPWELDPAQPRLAARLGPKSYHYVGLNRTEERLRRLFRAFPFGKLPESTGAGAPLYEIGISKRRTARWPCLRRWANDEPDFGRSAPLGPA
jgi:polysaccharide deacetylase family protein (PEP-CTERM system associated)